MFNVDRFHSTTTTTAAAAAAAATTTTTTVKPRICEHLGTRSIALGGVHTSDVFHTRGGSRGGSRGSSEPPLAGESLCTTTPSVDKHQN